MIIGTYKYSFKINKNFYYCIAEDPEGDTVNSKQEGKAKTQHIPEY
jgi:hypothetical protein